MCPILRENSAYFSAERHLMLRNSAIPYPSDRVAEDADSARSDDQRVNDFQGGHGDHAAPRAPKLLTTLLNGVIGNVSAESPSSGPKGSNQRGVLPPNKSPNLAKFDFISLKAWPMDRNQVPHLTVVH